MVWNSNLLFLVQNGSMDRKRSDKIKASNRSIQSSCLYGFASKISVARAEQPKNNETWTHLGLGRNLDYPYHPWLFAWLSGERAVSTCPPAASRVKPSSSISQSREFRNVRSHTSCMVITSATQIQAIRAVTSVEAGGQSVPGHGSPAGRC
jgi:hypothetical protein